MPRSPKQQPLPAKKKEHSLTVAEITSAAELARRVIHVRWMIRRDMPEVLAIEAATFSDAWGEEDFIHHLRQRNCIGLVAEDSDTVVGHMVYELHPKAIKVVNAAVDPKRLGEGIGTAFVQKLLGMMSSHRRRRVVVEVNERNLNALLFLKSHGFQATRVLRERFDSDDGIVMEFQLQCEAATIHNGDATRGR